MKLNVVLQESEDGGYDVTVPAFEGYFTQGHTMHEMLLMRVQQVLTFRERLKAYGNFLCAFFVL
jgi:predicted RNase H-like HicB family nuclease